MLNQQTVQQLTALGLKEMARVYENQTQQPESSKLSFEERLGMLVDAEIASRNMSKIQRLLKAAKLRYPDACIEDVIYKPKRNFERSSLVNFGDCTWIKKHQATIITGATGVGKSWVACAFGNQACRNYLSTIYMSATSMFESIHDAILQGTIAKLKRTLAKAKLLIIDDFGIASIDPQLGPSILEIIDQQSANGGLLITSQMAPEHWHDLFNNPTIADAVLDRIVHRAHRIDLKGDSMRKGLSKI